VYAGVMERDAGLTLVAHRARLMSAGEPGAMLTVPAPLERVTGWLAGTGLDLAAINGDEAVVVSGPRDDIRAFAERMREHGLAARLLAVSLAFHSRMMEPMLGAFAAAISPMRFGAPALPIIANVTGHPAGQETYNVDLLLEVGPNGSLVNLIRDGRSTRGAGAVASLRRGRPCRTTMLAAAKALYELGQDLDWRRLQPGPRGRAPQYPFADTRYWTAAVRPATARETSSPPGQQWGTELRSPALTGQAFAFEHSTEFPPYLADHRLYDTVVAPAASHFGSILSAVGRQGRAVTIEDLICQRALIIKDGERYQTQVLVDADATTLGVQALLDPARDRWQKLLSGRLSSQPAHPRPVPERAEFIGSAGRHIAGEAFYGYIRTLGYTLGPSFEWIAEVWVRGTEALIRYRQPALPDDATDYEMHPTLIDACLQSPAVFMVDDDADEAPSLAIPFAATRLSFPARPVPGEELWGHVTALCPEPLPNGRLRAEVADIHLFTGSGRSLFVAEEFRTR
jgi:acyl transferase domain-containing protein